MEFLIISGLSGAGKSQTADILEDLDFYCVDNMPVALLPKFAELCQATRGRYERVALVTDVREKDSFEELFKALDSLWEMGFEYKILFVEADVSTIVKRYKETRRRHPLAAEGCSIEEAVTREQVLLESVRERANFIINTSPLTIGQLQNEIYRIFVGENLSDLLQINVMSFGFKYGLPIEADLVFDVRFLPNPFYVAELREKTGMEKEVRDFIMKYDVSKDFFNLLTNLIGFLLPHYLEEGKHSLTIAVGCTGGRHRSVAVANALNEFIKSQGHNSVLINRDADKG